MLSRGRTWFYREAVDTLHLRKLFLPRSPWKRIYRPTKPSHGTIIMWPALIPMINLAKVVDAILQWHLFQNRSPTSWKSLSLMNHFTTTCNDWMLTFNTQICILGFNPWTTSPPESGGQSYYFPIVSTQILVWCLSSLTFSSGRFLMSLALNSELMRTLVLHLSKADIQR